MGQLNKPLELLTTLSNHNGSISSIRADKTYLYSGSKDDTLRIFKRVVGKRLLL